jgi:hypothetical protein
MDNAPPSFFDQALDYLRSELGPPSPTTLATSKTPTTSVTARRIHWALPHDGPHAGVIRIELEPDAVEGGVRLTIADPLASPPRRMEMATARTPAQLDLALAIVLDHLSGA